MNFYEAVIALKTESDESGQKKIFSQIQNIIQQFSGSLHHIDCLGSRALANLGKNKKIKRALYFHLSYQSKPAAIAEVERFLRMNDKALYFHHEKLDSRISLDKHQEHFEEILKNSKKREEERQARIQAKRKKFQSDFSAKDAVRS